MGGMTFFISTKNNKSSVPECYVIYRSDEIIRPFCKTASILLLSKTEPIYLGYVCDKNSNHGGSDSSARKT